MSLPTCWYCPKCGFVDNFCWKGPHYVPDQSRKCAGAMIELPAIPPGTPLTDILDTLGIPYDKGWENRGPGVDPFICFMGQTDKPVLVVDNPVTSEAHDV